MHPNISDIPRWSLIEAIKTRTDALLPAHLGLAWNHRARISRNRVTCTKCGAHKCIWNLNNTWFNRHAHI